MSIKAVIRQKPKIAEMQKIFKAHKYLLWWIFNNRSIIFFVLQPVVFHLGICWFFSCPKFFSIVCLLNSILWIYLVTLLLLEFSQSQCLPLSLSVSFCAIKYVCNEHSYVVFIQFYIFPQRQFLEVNFYLKGICFLKNLWYTLPTV